MESNNKTNCSDTIDFNELEGQERYNALLSQKDPEIL